MTQASKTLADALAALEGVRLENARLRRKVLDLLYNLDEENMPTVIARIKATEDKLAAENEGLSLLITTDEEGVSHLRGDAIVEAVNALGATLSVAALAVTGEKKNEALTLEGGSILLRRETNTGSRTYEDTATLSPALLEMRIVDAASVSGGETLSLSPRGLCMPYVRRRFKTDKSGLYPLYIDGDGNLVAATS